MRPFGLVGAAYRGRGSSEIAHWLQWVSAGLAAVAYWGLPASWVLPKWLGFAAGLVLSVAFGIVVAMTGERSPSAAEKVAKTFD